ncbi:AAA family ATPase [uncultured Clostridium sp.]|uniref:AAA family ATPase n=1 Tax=uncultured Clostridium sp. TaxID=59620 RepID=UPI00260740E8|nr:AAA family ATPase [uncultured Clostridium sp.]
MSIKSLVSGEKFIQLSDEVDSYKDYVGRVQKLLSDDLYEAYPNLQGKKFLSVTDMLRATNDRFIFLIDEWDYIFNNNLFVESRNDYLEFLRNLLKDRPYVLLAYMTGVLPIKKYSSGSALNMFDEFTFLKDRIFEESFVFLEKEVQNLCEKGSGVSFEEISEWYNGYLTVKGSKIYNPRSVVKALQNNYCESYWTNTGAMDEVGEYLKYNILEVREDVIKMISGQDIEEEFRAGQETPKTKEEIYSAMIVLGFLAYHDGLLKIPNKELMLEFEKAIKDESFGGLAKLITNSKDMLSATVEMNIRKVEEIFHNIHNSEIPIIIELKKNEKAEVAINQIIEKEYYKKFIEDYNKNLIVAITYNTKTKEHICLMKIIEK